MVLIPDFRFRRGKGSDQIAVEASTRTMTPPDARPDRERTARRSLKPWEVFEQQIHQIYTLLERFEAEVTWNDRIIDPDQPTRRRQIDITIKRDDHLTIIECRLRQSRQNVQWIEELIGRRQSLQANEVIAVSSSGFTSGAVAKANSHDIITRDLPELTDDEVKNWGRSIALTLYFFSYSDIHLTIVFHAASLQRLQMDGLKAELAKSPALVSIFNAAAKLVGQRLIPAVEHQGLIATFGGRLALEDFRLCGESVIDVQIEGKARLVSQEVHAPTVSAYGSPTEPQAKREAIIERFPLGETSIVHDGHRISTFIDISHVKMPSLHQFRYFRVLSPNEVDHEVLSLSGIDKLHVQTGRIDVTVVGQG